MIDWSNIFVLYYRLKSKSNEKELCAATNGYK